jgi:hypothetical protein
MSRVVDRSSMNMSGSSGSMELEGCTEFPESYRPK